MPRTVSRPENWAIICGMIRLELEFRITVNAVMDLKRKGLIDQIILATWRRSLVTYRELKGELLSLGIIILEVPGLEEGGYGQTFRQHRLLEEALKICPAGSAVLKLRTDKAVHRLSVFEEVMESGPKDLGKDESFKSICPFTARICTQAASVTIPFNFPDFVFYGYARDLEKLVHMDVYYDNACFPNTMNAETRMFSKPFIENCLFFRQFFSRFNCRILSQFFIDSNWNQVQGPFGGLLADVFALNLKVIGEFFYILNDRGEVPDFSAKDLMLGRTRSVSRLSPLTKTNQILIFNQKVIEKLLNTSEPVEGFGEISKSLMRIQDANYYQRIWPLEETQSCYRKYLSQYGFGHTDDCAVRDFAQVIIPSEEDERHSELELKGLGENISISEIERAYIRENAPRLSLGQIYFDLHQRAKSESHEDNSHWLELAAKYEQKQALYEMGVQLFGLNRREKGLKLLKKSAKFGYKIAAEKLLNYEGEYPGILEEGIDYWKRFCEC